MSGLRVAMTGAAGFIGRAVLQRVKSGALGPLDALRLNDLHGVEHAGAEIVCGSYATTTVREQLLAGGVDVLFHLASLPGGAAERHPALGKTVNLDGSIALFDALAATAVAGRRVPVVVYASSIAALGAAGSYGTHKAMVELYLADLTRRGLLDGRSVRPAGIVARPREAYEGFATAWMSELFHAAVQRRSVAIPVRAAAQVWLQSVGIVADNIIHAALMSSNGLPAHRAWTLPATVVVVQATVEALRRRTGHALAVEYGDGPMNQPALDATAALALGFRSDGDTDALVDAVVTRLERLEQS